MDATTVILNWERCRLS